MPFNKWKIQNSDGISSTRNWFGCKVNEIPTLFVYRCFCFVVWVLIDVVHIPEIWLKCSESMTVILIMFYPLSNHSTNKYLPIEYSVLNGNNPVQANEINGFISDSDLDSDRNFETREWNTSTCNSRKFHSVLVLVRVNTKAVAYPKSI